MELTERKRLALIVLAAIALRGLWALLVPVDPVSDSSMYDAFARQIAGGHGYSYPDGTPTVYWPVGPSALYGFFYWIAGSQAWVVPAVNLVLGAGLVACTYFIGRQLGGPAVALLAAILVACWPLLIEFTTVLNSELAFMVFVCAAVLAWRPDSASVRRAAAVGALIAVASYMRPTALPMVVLLPAIGYLRHRQWRIALVQMLVCGLAAAILITPWALRNRAVFGSPVAISANFGANLWMGNNPASTGGYMPLPASVRGMHELERDNRLKAEAVAFIRSNPLDFVRLCARRLAISFGRESIGVAWNEKSLPAGVQTALKAASSAYWWIVVLLAVPAIFRFARRDRGWLHPAILLPAMFGSIAVLVVGQDRYHMPLIPFLAVFAAFTLAQKARKQGR